MDEIKGFMGIFAGVNPFFTISWPTKRESACLRMSENSLIKNGFLGIK